jgi:hypothetical protein
MNCPYCLSEVSEEAYVCKICSRDLYLFKPMMAKVADLEAQLAEKPSNEVYEARIEELESLLEDLHQKHATRSFLNWVTDIVFYLIVPLLLLLLAHWLITVVYDTKMLYLRIVSIALPLPFAYFLFKSHSHKLLPWFVGVVFLALASVIGMSWITSLVDHSPVWPQNLFEWKEVVQYATSIAFSFLTGMLLGRIAYNAKQKRKKVKLLKSPLLIAPLNNPSTSLEGIHGVLKKLQEYGGTIVALGTTAVSIYTGLKGIIGS